ncbi:MAG: TatD family hydrolase [Candidatus Njordarchaeales archaeon]
MATPYVDAHAHIYGFSLEVIANFVNNYNLVIIGVAEDLESSLRILEISNKIPKVIPAIGIHPWNIQKADEKSLEKVLELAHNVKILGEIGLDKRFAKESIEKQRKFLEKFLVFASENNLRVNLHTLDAWNEILDLLIKYEIEKAIFHWYSGPLPLLKELEAQGYFITINPAVKFQRKHRMVLEKAPIEIILTESDGPYNYRGVSLTPELIPEVVKEIADVKEISEQEAKEIIYKNFQKFLS